jgi:signal transduction histidine kinase
MEGGALLPTDASGVKCVADRAQDNAERSRVVGLEQNLSARVEELERCNRDLETFVRALAHDSASLIRGASLRVDMLRERLGTTDDEVQGMLTAITDRTARLAELSEALLRLVGIDGYELKHAETNLSALAERIVLSLHAQTPDRLARFDIEPGLVAEGDAALLTVALENLLGNSWKFSAHSAPTHIAFGRRASDGAYYVNDNGIGFTPAQAATLFEPFVRLHSAFAGSGLGLSTVKRIIERHGGWIRAEGRLGHGATFIFSLHAKPGDTPAR